MSNGSDLIFSYYPILILFYLILWNFPLLVC